jgi:hypothetical protein|tara:strand:- start:1126 stop:1533 length:408 start_codon:yes stop_codon:yes gene_type:complete
MSKKNDKIDPDQIKMLASFGCSYVEIGKYFECDESTIRKRFKAKVESGKEEMKFSLRRAMWTSAMENNSIAMQIFMAKNYLGMSDKTAIDMTGNLETVLKECGFEENPVDKTNSEQAEALESFGVQPDSTATGIS